MYRKLLIVVLAAIVVLLGGCRLWDSITGNATSELIDKLREYFDIDHQEATDAELRDYLQDGDERTFADAVVLEYEFGTSVDAFVYRNERFGEDLEQDFYRHVSSSGVLGTLSGVAKASGMIYFGGMVDALHILSTIGTGLAIMESFSSSVENSGLMSVILEEYFISRDHLRADAAPHEVQEVFDEVYDVFDDYLYYMFSLIDREIPDKEEQEEFLAHYFEVRYQAYMLATDQEAQREVKEHILAKIPTPPPGKSFEGYVLTSNRYRVEDVDLDAVVEDEFGLGATVADWQDIKSEFSGRVREFCKGVGLPNQRDTGNHHGAFVYNGGSRYYNCPRWDGRHYFVTFFDGSLPGNYQVHDSIDNRTLCLGSWYRKEMEVLVKLP